jgi:hypothetical protein
MLSRASLRAFPRACIRRLAATRRVQRALLARAQRADRFDPARLRPELLLASGAMTGPHRAPRPQLHRWPALCADVRGFLARLEW